MEYCGDKVFNNLDFNIADFPIGEYEQCTFHGCDFGGLNLSKFKFISCKFRDCNLSMVKLSKTALQDVNFIGCKILGVDFSACHDFGLAMSFDHCNLSHSIFEGVKLKKPLFRDCILYETDFTAAQLSNALFDHCDLDRAIFVNTELMHADLYSSYHYKFDPASNHIAGARFSTHGVSGLLSHFNIKIEE